MNIFIFVKIIQRKTSVLQEILLLRYCTQNDLVGGLGNQVCPRLFQSIKRVSNCFDEYVLCCLLYEKKKTLYLYSNVQLNSQMQTVSRPASNNLDTPDSN